MKCERYFITTGIKQPGANFRGVCRAFTAQKQHQHHLFTINSVPINNIFIININSTDMHDIIVL